jgi:hypothetical protein
MSVLPQCPQIIEVQGEAVHILLTTYLARLVGKRQNQTEVNTLGLSPSDGIQSMDYI